MHRYSLLSLFCLVLILPSLAYASAEYVGSERCASCHTSEYQAWQESHHFKAMQPVSEETVLGDFNNAEFEYFGVKSRFYRKGKEFWVDTDNAKGEIESFKIAYVFGVEPLQQYLIAFPNGRYQALNVVWDTRPKSEGGQRWYHLYADAPVDHRDPLHWTGAFQNWNSRCASCHSTNLRKNYDVATDSYQTDWSEINVACEACHGPASAHLKWTQAPNLSDKLKGFSHQLSDAGRWVPEEGSDTLKREGAERPSAQINTCAHCHSRRVELSDPPHSTDFLQSHQSRFLTEDLYFPDGQILDEVYVFDAFLQSKMHREGVVCSNCHEPHSGKLRLPGNGVCAQCHQPEQFDTPKHHHHPEGSPGSACANCHMPERVYMGVDARRDHGLKIPRPDISEAFGTPNACNQCHSDKSASWALQVVEKWYGADIKQRKNHASAFSKGWQGDPGGLHALIRIANDPDENSIYRASALQALANYPGRDTYELALQMLRSDDPMLRVASLRVMDFVPPERRQMLLSLLNEPVKAVRLELAPLIAAMPKNNLPAEIKPLLDELFAEYIEAQQFNGDMPAAQLNLGNFYTQLGDTTRAEQAYQRALKLAPDFVPGLLNYADFLRAVGRDSEALGYLKKAIDIAPEQAPAHHALGLLYVRLKQLDNALEPLKKAAELQPATARYSYVYGVALESSGQLKNAINVLEKALQMHPADRQIQAALMHYYQKDGQATKANLLRQSLQRGR